MPASALHEQQRQNQPTKTCETCGEVFTRRAGSHEPHAKFMARRFCSRECLSRRTGISLWDRFHGMIGARSDEAMCWVWQGATLRAGYGVIGRGARVDGLIPVHVVAWELYRGRVPDGLVLDHLCRNPGCVNPQHLEPVTPAENARRGAKAKVTHADVARIRAQVAAGQRQKDVARLYGLHPAHVSRIISGKRWGPDGSVERIRHAA